MTSLTSIIKRELPDRLRDRGRHIVAEISEDGIAFRRKGTREVYDAPWGVLYASAQRCTAAAKGITMPARAGGKDRYHNV